MSTRRKPGDIVIKKAGAGFVGEPLVIRIPTELSYMPDIAENTDWCMMDCGDGNCREYANLQVLDPRTLAPISECCHVAECEMQELARPGDSANWDA